MTDLRKMTLESIVEDYVDLNVKIAVNSGIDAIFEDDGKEHREELRRRDEREAALVLAAKGVIEAHESKWVTVYGAHDRWNDRFSKLSAALAAYPEVPNG